MTSVSWGLDNLPIMGKRESKIGIGTLKNQIVNTSLIFGVIMYAIAFSISFSNVPNYFNKVNYITNSIVLSSVIIVALLRNRLSLRVKSIFLIAALVIAVILHIIWLGIYSEYMPLIIMVPFFAILAFNLRESIIIFILAIGSIVILGLLHVNNILTVRQSDLDRYHHLQTWVLALLILSFVSVGILIIITKFYNTFHVLVNDLKTQNIKLQFSEQSYREIFNSTTDAILKLDYNGEIEDINDAACQMFGYSHEEFIHFDWSNSKNREREGYTYIQASKYLQDVKTKGNITFEWLSQHKNGNLFWVEIAIKTTYILGEKKLLAVVRNIDEKKKIQLQLDEYRNRLEDIVNDRTIALHNANDELTRMNGNLYLQKEELRIALDELKDAHNKLLQSEKMATLGILAAGIAHEVNSPLQYIQAGAIGLEAYFEDTYNQVPTEVNMLLSSINEGVSRSANIVASLNQFSRQKNELTESVNIHNVIENCLNILGNKLKYKISVEKQFFKDNIIIIGNEGQLHQVIINVLTNAIQAIEDEGKILIKTSIKDHQAHLSFIDNGHGIKPEDINRLTEPFFTTKPSGEGTGLGLSITQKIIEEHKGKINFTSEPDLGTTVTITFPI